MNNFKYSFINYFVFNIFMGITFYKFYVTTIGVGILCQVNNAFQILLYVFMINHFR